MTPDKTANTNQTSVTLQDLSSGEHWFGVHGLDNAGNWGSDLGSEGIARTSVRVDVTLPGTVTNLHSTSHDQAIGQYDCVQSSDQTVDVSWTAATDAHSGLAGYSIAWNQDANTGPGTVQILDAAVVSTTSDPLDEGKNWYFHIRAVDQVGNWDDDFATLGPFYIKYVTPTAPDGVTATAGNATLTVKWNKVHGVPAVTYNVYRRQEGESYGTPVGESLQDTSFTENWPNVLNGETYYYVVTATGISWDGSSPQIRHCRIERCSGGGIEVSPGPGGTCLVDSNMVLFCEQTGIYVFGTPNSSTRVTGNQVADGGSGIFYDVNPAAQPPQFLNIADNQVLRHEGDGIICGNGAATITVLDNTVLENENGIVFNSEGWLIAAPLIQGNDVSGNRNAGIYTAQQAAPIVKDNRIVQNGRYGCYSRTNAYPSYSGNTITGSQYGFFVENSAVAVPDFGSNPPGSHGTNRLDGHTLAWMWNNGGVAMNAINNWWGTAQANPAFVIDGAMPINWNPVWNVVNQAPTITLVTPNGVAACDSVAIKWIDSDPDPADDASINLFYDDDNLGLDGTQIKGASNISEDDGADSLVWDTSLIKAGTYYVYAIISDDAESASDYSPGSVTIEHPDITVLPESLWATIEPGSTSTDTITVRNDGTASLSATLHSGAEWLVLGDSLASVAAGDSSMIELTWDASSLSDGDYATTIEVASDDHADSLIALPATLRVEKPEIELSTSSIGFGGVEVDSTSTQPLEVRNVGTGDLIVTGIGTAPPFSVSGASPPDTIAAGDTLALSVSYTPTGPSTDVDTLTVSSSDSDEPTLEVVVSGTGLAPEVSLGDSTHDYGTVDVGSSASWSMYVFNQGTSNLLLSSASFDTAGFTLVSPQLAASVAPGGSLEVTIGFEPAEARDYSGTLTIETNDSDESEVSLNLSGTGALPEAVLVGVPVYFDSVRVGASADEAIWVRNNGEDTLMVTGATTATPFSAVSPVFPAQVLAGESLQVTVRFEPQDTDSASADLYVTTNAPTTPTLETALSGIGIEPAVALSVSSLDFGAVHADSSDTLTIIVRNQGSDALTVSQVYLDSGSNFGVSAPATPFAISPGDSESIEVAFLSSPVGSYLDTLWLGSDDPEQPLLFVPISAQAVAAEVTVFILVTTSGPQVEVEVPPSGYDFGGSALGEKLIRSFRIRNTGGYSLNVDSLSVAPSTFSVEDTLELPDTVQPGKFLALPLSFTTDSMIAIAGSLTVVTNDRETPRLVIPLAGHGVDVVAGLFPDSLSRLFSPAIRPMCSSISPTRLRERMSTSSGYQSHRWRRAQVLWLRAWNGSPFLIPPTGWLELIRSISIYIWIQGRWMRENTMLCFRYLRPMLISIRAASQCTLSCKRLL